MCPLLKNSGCCNWGLPGGDGGKGPARHCRSCRGCRFGPEWGGSPGGGDSCRSRAPAWESPRTEGPGGL